ncbi:butyrate kinase [Deinococcus aquiradiocola]|uniref:Probable butyrate kinase n=1 Tax=Deinococcus aquiradiocola TaxID=393059 RepID=A0A917USB9_9DEIO|nr:butyrate kinase [Deinococcus aquiradiocola]GGJ81498.1 putative butyrate kinase [Deinococcus aquiradiocola]
MLAYVINPGSSSTRLALADIQPSENPDLPGQLRLTLTRAELDLPDTLQTLTPLSGAWVAALVADLHHAARDWPAPDAVVSRGGAIGEVTAGTFVVTPELAAHALTGQSGEHSGNVGAALALGLARQYGVPALIVDPPSLDERLPEARESGLPGVPRSSRFHTLNAGAVARRAAYEVGRSFHDARVVVAHLGAGISVTAFDKGRAIDTSGISQGEGPFSATRAGPLPLPGLLDLAYRLPRPELEAHLTQAGGFVGLTGSGDLRELERREKADPQVRLAADAFVQQVCKALGAYSAALPGRPDALAISGGIARWQSLIDRIERRVAWIAPLTVIPGELELEALAEGAGRVLLGLEEAQEWQDPARLAVQPAGPEPHPDQPTPDRP